MESPVIGILGGVGPMATAYFMEMIINMTEATKDQDHINMLVSNHATIPDRTDYILGKSQNSPLNVMIDDAKMLQNAGCDFIVLPCNTAHYFFDGIKNAIEIPFLNIIEETVDYCIENIENVKKLGIMATEGTLKSNTYGMIAEKRNLKCVSPSDEMQNKITSIIYDKIKAGKNVTKEEFVSIIDYLKSQGCDAVILGCTELSVAFENLKLKEEYPYVVDSLTVLAERSVIKAGKKIKKS